MFCYKIYSSFTFTLGVRLRTVHCANRELVLQYFYNEIIEITLNIYNSSHLVIWFKNTCSGFIIVTYFFDLTPTLIFLTFGQKQVHFFRIPSEDFKTISVLLIARFFGTRIVFVNAFLEDFLSCIHSNVLHIPTKHPEIYNWK